MKKRILFVCLGNICRSPAAEGIMNHLIYQKNLQHVIDCDSAGTINYHQGRAPDSRMSKTLQEVGINLYSNARQINRYDLNAFDYILTMDDENHRNVLALCNSDEERNRVQPICHFNKQYTEVTEVPDPYYGGPEGFTYVKDLLFDACQGFLDSIVNEQSLPVITPSKLLA